MQSGEIDRAKEIFDQLYEDFPESAYGPYGLAVHNKSEGLFYRAMKYSQEALKINSKFNPALLLSAELTLRIKRPELAFFYIGTY